MPEPAEENKPVIVETVMGIVGDVTGKKPKFKTHFHPIGSDGISFTPIKKLPEPVYDKRGQPITNPLLGNIVDVEA